MKENKLQHLLNKLIELHNEFVRIDREKDLNRWEELQNLIFADTI